MHLLANRCYLYVYSFEYAYRLLQPSLPRRNARSATKECSKIHSQLRTSNSKNLCLAVRTKLEPHHSRLPQATGLCHVEYNPRLLSTTVNKFYLTHYCIFTQFNFLNLVFFLLTLCKTLERSKQYHSIRINVHYARNIKSTDISEFEKYDFLLSN
jgi:hypothetical protein